MDLDGVTLWLTATGVIFSTHPQPFTCSRCQTLHFIGKHQYATASCLACAPLVAHEWESA